MTQPLRLGIRAREGCLLVISAVLLVGCGDGPGSVTNYTSPEEVFDRLTTAGVGCSNEPSFGPTSAGPPAQVGICGPVAGADGLFAVAVFRNSGAAASEFRAKCSSSQWNFFREGQTWRATLGGDSPVPKEAAEDVAEALGTDAIAGCGSNN